MNQLFPKVVAIWEEGSATAKQFERSIMVCDISRDPQYIKSYHGCYDPLSYLLFSLEVRLDGTRKYYMQTMAMSLKVIVFICECDSIYHSLFSQLVHKQYLMFQLMEM
jgi:hypothetical protein